MSQDDQSLFKRNPLYTAEEVAQYFKVDVATVRRMVARGELPARRVANEYRFTDSDIRRYLDSVIIRPNQSIIAEAQAVEKDGEASHVQEHVERGSDGNQEDSFDLG